MEELKKMKNMRVQAFTALEQAAGQFGDRSGLFKKLIESGIEVSPQSVANWKRVPMKYVRVVSDISGISVSELMPEAFATVNK